MKILILDDNMDRHEAFARHYIGHDVQHVTHALSCIAALGAARFDIVHLDHDLGDFESENGEADYWVDGWGSRREYNGQNVALALVDLPDELLPGQVIIHSVNPEGARRMLAIVANAGIPVVWEPFNGESFATAVNR